MKNAITKAIEGGWNKDRATVTDLDTRDGYEGLANSMQSTDKALLDPLFWQALGKSMGWSSDWDMRFSYINRPVELKVVCPEWQYHWHCLLDHLANGKDAESFFASLLK